MKKAIYYLIVYLLSFGISLFIFWVYGVNLNHRGGDVAGAIIISMICGAVGCSLGAAIECGSDFFDKR